MKLIFIHAAWCGPCKTMVPIIEKLKDHIEILDFDVDIPDNDVLISKYHVRNIPVFVLEDSIGTVLWKHVGTIKENELIDKLKEYEAYKE